MFRGSSANASPPANGELWRSEMYPIQKRLLKILGLCVLGAACDGRSSSPTAPSTSAQTRNSSAAPSLSASSQRRGDLHVTKECSEYFGRAGEFCTITSSNLKQIEVGSRVVYAEAAGATSLDSDVVLDPPGPGNNEAFGHRALEFATGRGVCTFSGGTGKFTHF